MIKIRTIRSYKILAIIFLILTCLLTLKDISINVTLVEYDGLEFIAKDQPIVDDQVMVKVNIHHPGFIAIYNSTGQTFGSILGYSYTVEGMDTHNHTRSLTLDGIKSMVNGEDHTSFNRIPLSQNGRTDTLYARLFNDTNMDMKFNMDGTDKPYKDASDKEVVEPFQVTGNFPTTIEVQDQIVKLTDTDPLVHVDKVIVARKWY